MLIYHRVAIVPMKTMAAGKAQKSLYAFSMSYIAPSLDRTTNGKPNGNHNKTVLSRLENQDNSHPRDPVYGVGSLEYRLGDNALA